MSEPEPRRSVRATKGQHKALDQLDQVVEAPKRRGKKGKKAPEPEEPEEEVIRCVCGATEQVEDSGEPWIACDLCAAWQHNICMGMSQYTEDLPKNYFCERCRPDQHKELIAGIARGERPWEARRKAYEDEMAEKKKKGTKKTSKKRTSDSRSDVRDESSQPPQKKLSPAPQAKPKHSPAPPSKAKQSPAPPPSKSKQSPAPPEPKKDAKPSGGTKRKTMDGPQEKEKEPKPNKIRRISENKTVAVPLYTAPNDIPTKIADLPEGRQGGAKALLKSLSNVISAGEKKGIFAPIDGVSASERAERLALEIERAIHDTHPNQTSYAHQSRTVAYNLKANPDLVPKLLSRALTPPMLAVMSSEDLASKELQKETAEMKARAEKQAIKITEDVPRIRKTHKGDEIIGDDDFIANEDVPLPPVRRPSVREPAVPRPEAGPESLARADQARSPPKPLAVNTQHSPSRADFDINKVFSSVKSPTLPQSQVRTPVVAALPSGPGVDPEVDRLLNDSSQSPPYSPSAESDPDVVWRGNLVMTSIAEFQVTAKHIGGVKLNETIDLPWDQLIPSTLRVGGRIAEEPAIVYLCSLRYSLPTDVTVVSLEPTSPSGKEEMQKLLTYFTSKKRYGVVLDKGVANVRDTYLVPVPPGTGNQPEFMLNLVDNYIPETRTEPMLLAVFVYRNDPEVVQRIHGPPDDAFARMHNLPVAGPMRSFANSPATPTPAQSGYGHPNRKSSVPNPQFSPATPQGSFFDQPSASHPPQSHQPPAPAQARQDGTLTAAEKDRLQREGEIIAREVLGHYSISPTLTFLLPQAWEMKRREWELIREIYERDPRTRDDLPYLSAALERHTAMVEQPATTQAAPLARAAPQAQALPPASAPPALQASPVALATPAPLATAVAQIPQQAEQQPLPPPSEKQQSRAQPQHPSPQLRNTPIPQPSIPQMAAAPPRPTPPTPSRQTPIPPPPIPPQVAAAAAAAGPHA